MFYLLTAGYANSLISEEFQTQAQSKRTQLLQGIPTSPFLFLSATPSLLKGLWSLIFPWQYFCLSFIKKHCQQHILTISFSFLIWAMTTNHTHKSCGIIGKWPWWYDSFLSWECKCFASWGFAFFSSFNRTNLGKETVWSTKEGGATETLKRSWAHIISFIKIHT